MIQAAIRKLLVASGTTSFRGKGRLINYWLAHRPRDARTLRKLPGGARIECDLAFDYDCMVYLEQEEEGDLGVLRSLLRPADTFVDGGANIGLWTLVAAMSAPRGQVIAFEPNPATAARLRRHVHDINRLRNVRVEESALGERSGQGVLAPGAAHNVSRMNATGPGIPVPVTTLDEALGGARVDGIKLDVEGSELDALRGAAAAIARHAPWICVEFNTMLAGTSVLGEWPVDGFLRERGYSPRLFRDACRPHASALPSGWETTGYVNLHYSRTQ